MKGTFKKAFLLGVLVLVGGIVNTASATSSYHSQYMAGKFVDKLVTTSFFRDHSLATRVFLVSVMATGSFVWLRSYCYAKLDEDAKALAGKAAVQPSNEDIAV